MTSLVANTAQHPAVIECTEVVGTEHDYRPVETTSVVDGRPIVSLVCVWCRAVSCGNASDRDPCVEPYHHQVEHRTARGLRWPIGGTRPDLDAR